MGVCCSLFSTVYKTDGTKMPPTREHNHSCYISQDGSANASFDQEKNIYDDGRTRDQQIISTNSKTQIFLNFNSKRKHQTWVFFFSCSSFTNVPGLEPPSKSVYTGSIFWPLPSLKCCINSERADSERPLHFCFSEVSTDDTTQHSQGYMTSAFSLLRVSHFTCNRTEIEAF